MRVNLNADFALKISALGTLCVVHGAVTRRVTGDLSHAFSECVGFHTILAKLRELHDAAQVAAERAGKHTRANWQRTLDQLRGAIMAVQGDEQAWTAETLRITGAKACAAARWHKGVKAGLHSLYAFARTPEQAAEEIMLTVRIVARDMQEAA